MKKRTQSISRFLPIDQNSTLSMGCSDCRFFERCGGLRDDSKRFSCFDRCAMECGADCGNACPNNRSFVRRVDEVGGLWLDAMPFAPIVPLPELPEYIPLIDQKYLLGDLGDLEIVAIPVRRLISISRRCLKFNDAAELRSSFGLGKRTKVLALGVSKDDELENFWSLQKDVRFIEALRRLKLSAITAPNFSSFVDQPRTEDLANQKRMLWCAHNLQSKSMPVALHWNIFNERDFKQFEIFLREHIEYEALTIEFGSGLRSSHVAGYFLRKLVETVRAVRRPMRLIMKGGIRYVQSLRGEFHSVSFIDSKPFHAARQRQQLRLGNDGRLLESLVRTDSQGDVRRIFEFNVRTRKQQLLDTGRNWVA